MWGIFVQAWGSSGFPHSYLRAQVILRGRMDILGKVEGGVLDSAASKTSGHPNMLVYYAISSDCREFHLMQGFWL